jgi:DNA-binding CsgD family transcriptional regulator
MKSLVTHNILSSMQQSDPVELAEFTAREIECLKWVAAGKTDAEIAEILQLSRKTVFWHINGATKRMNASSRSHAVANAFRMGLIN